MRPVERKCPLNAHNGVRHKKHRHVMVEIQNYEALEKASLREAYVSQMLHMIREKATFHLIKVGSMEFIFALYLTFNFK
jgi:hypothetical protein